MEAIGRSKHLPRGRSKRDGGREVSGWLNLSLTFKCVRVSGRWIRGRLKFDPKVKCVRVGGRAWSGRLNA